MRLVHGSNDAEFHRKGVCTHPGNGSNGDAVGKDKQDDEDKGSTLVSILEFLLIHRIWVAG